MVVPRLLFDRTAFRGAGCYSLSGLPDRGCPKQTVLDNPDRAIRSSTGETRPVLWHSHGKPEPGLRGHAIQRPTLHFGPIPALIWRPGEPLGNSQKNSREGRQALIPLPQPAVGVVVSEPIWDDRRGPKTHSRRTGRKLGQVRCTRQALVRLPLSNTKYGG